MAIPAQAVCMHVSQFGRTSARSSLLVGFLRASSSSLSFLRMHTELEHCPCVQWGFTMVQALESPCASSFILAKLWAQQNLELPAWRLMEGVHTTDGR